MIEQWYAKHRVTGEIFCHKGRYCFSEKGLLQSLRNEKKWDDWWSERRSTVRKPFLMSDWEIKKVELK